MAFTSIPGTTYNISIIVNIPNQPLLQASHRVIYKIKSSDLVVYIVGGNRLQAYAKPLNISGVGKDPDVIPV